jgi:hypothetical protein
MPGDAGIGAIVEAVGARRVDGRINGPAHAGPAPPGNRAAPPRNMASPNGGDHIALA